MPRSRETRPLAHLQVPDHPAAIEEGRETGDDLHPIEPPRIGNRPAPDTKRVPTRLDRAHPRELSGSPGERGARGRAPHPATGDLEADGSILGREEVPVDRSDHAGLTPARHLRHLYPPLNGLCAGDLESEFAAPCVHLYEMHAPRLHPATHPAVDDPGLQVEGGDTHGLQVGNHLVGELTQGDRRLIRRLAADREQGGGDDPRDPAAQPEHGAPSRRLWWLRHEPTPEDQDYVAIAVKHRFVKQGSRCYLSAS